MSDSANTKRMVFMVPHTHWDREWYFTTRQSKVLLLETLAVVLDELETGNLPCFVLDGQTSLLEDYLEMAPEEESRLAQLVDAGKLHVGPWYTQTDQCVVGAESIVRNLLYGIRDARKFGGHMTIAYIPDSFGQSEQLPQILSQFGLSRCVFWRGWWEGICAQTEFNWQSRDGSAVTTVVIPTGYSGVKGMPADSELHDARMRLIRNHVETLEKRNTTTATLLMAGNDQQPWDPRLPQILAEENARQSDYVYELGDMHRIFDVLEREAELQEVRSEMLAGKYSRIHRGIYSTRYDIKRANAEAETLLTHILEPVLSIGWSLGMSWPGGLLEQTWKKLLKSHAHDSIGCCNSDEVNDAVKQRLVDARQIAEQQLQLRMRQISERVVSEQPGERLVLFNTLPFARNESIEVTLVLEASQASEISVTNGLGERLAFQPLAVEAVHLSELVQDLGAALKPGQSGDPVYYRHRLLLQRCELPALGYACFYVNHDDSAVSEDEASPPEHGPGVIENEHLRLSVATDGAISLECINTGRTQTGLVEFIDGGDDGDNYDFSPPRADWLISTRGRVPEIEIRRGPIQNTARLSWSLGVPSDLEHRARKEANAILPISACLTLTKNSRLLEVDVEVDNRAEDHRLQAVFRTGLDTDESIADQPFGLIRRPSKPPELAEWEAGWTSKPLALYPMQGLVALSDGDSGLALFTRGIREYQVDEDDTGTLALTLFRSVGFMGKPDLVYRPGRLSGMPMPTPDSQIPGHLQFHFAVRLFKNEVAPLVQEARQFLSPLQAHHVSNFNKFSINSGAQDFPSSYSVLSLESDLTVSAIKRAEDENVLLIRMFNPFDYPVEVGSIVAADTGLAALHCSNMNEVLESKVAIDQCLTAQPQQAITLAFELEPS